MNTLIFYVYVRIDYTPRVCRNKKHDVCKARFLQVHGVDYTHRVHYESAIYGYKYPVQPSASALQRFLLYIITVAFLFTTPFDLRDLERQSSTTLTALDVSGGDAHGALKYQVPVKHYSLLDHLSFCFVAGDRFSRRVLWANRRGTAQVRLAAEHPPPVHGAGGIGCLPASA